MRANRDILFILLAAAFFMLVESRSALAQTFYGSQGSLSAEAIFSSSGANLDITFKNTSPVPVSSNGEVLTALFFTVTPASASTTSLSAGSINLSNGSSYVHTASGDNSNPSDVGMYWAFKQLDPPNPGAYIYGISSTGLGIFSPNETFLLSGGSASLGGAGYGLVSGVSTDANNGLKTPLINNGVFIVLNHFNNGGMITNVSFQFGTSTDEPHFNGTVPTPNSFAIAAVAMAFGLLWIRRERLRGV